MIVTVQHLRTIPFYREKPGFCLPKTREWFKRHGLDFRAFVRNGIPSEQLLATGDGMAIAMVEWAEQCEARKHG